MKRKILLIATMALCVVMTFAQDRNPNRFPKPDFESGYEYPLHQYVVPAETFLVWLDIVLLVVLMSFVAWAVIKRVVRWPIIVVSIISIAYFGFFRKGCVCSIGSISNVALALGDSSYTIPFAALLFFIIPILFSILFGRVFCAGVCPFGALQELINVKNYRLSKTVSTVLGLIPWVYLTLAVLFAVTNSQFIICRFDPFIGMFRLGGDVPLILFGGVLLVMSIFTGRPFCRFICPYGIVLGFFSRVAIWNIKITRQGCINCELCHNSCPVDAIRPPYENKVKENRNVGVQRLLVYILIIPLMAVTGGIALRLLSDPLSRMNKEVRLLEMVLENERNPQEVLSVELEAFYELERTVPELTAKVTAIQDKYRLIATYCGIALGIIFGFTLISLSVKRSRKLYEIEDSKCVNCARCFSYCPQNKGQVQVALQSADSQLL
ncbi:MAG: 4Fe-4S binding protein [Tannerella sp.]|jgi:polyferredoxin|nr:4Fe-4S binding protein [Tannerella sp.]